MTVTIKLFAAARDLVGAEEIEIELPKGANFGELRAALIAAAPRLATIGGRALFAADARYVSDEDLVPETAEIAFILPVSGG